MIFSKCLFTAICMCVKITKSIDSLLSDKQQFSVSK